MGPAVYPKKQSRKSFSGLDTTNCLSGLSALEEQVRHLETWRSEIVSRLRVLEDVEARLIQLETHTGLLPFEVLFPRPRPKPPRPGPRPRLTKEELDERRKRLLGPIESCWREIADPLAKAQSQQEIRAAFSPILLPYYGIAEMLGQRMGALVAIVTTSDLLKTRIVTNKVLKDWETNEQDWASFNLLPSRKLINAIAGVPEYSWRPSYDACRRRPLAYVLHANVCRYLEERAAKSSVSD